MIVWISFIILSFDIEVIVDFSLDGKEPGQ